MHPHHRGVGPYRDRLLNIAMDARQFNFLGKRGGKVPYDANSGFRAAQSSNSLSAWGSLINATTTSL